MCDEVELSGTSPTNPNPLPPLKLILQIQPKPNLLQQKINLTKPKHPQLRHHLNECLQLLLHKHYHITQQPTIQFLQHKCHQYQKHRNQWLSYLTR